MSRNRRMLIAATRRVQADAEELVESASSGDAEDQLAAQAALQNWIILDQASKGSEEEVEEALTLIESDFPEILPS